MDRYELMFRRLPGESGQSLIEMALVVPVFFLMAFGFIDFSLIMFGMGTATFAGRAATRYASTHSNTSYQPVTQQDLNNIVGNYIFIYPANTWTVGASYNAGNVVGGGVYVTVSITYSFHLFSYTYGNISSSTTGVSVIVQ